MFFNVVRFPDICCCNTTVQKQQSARQLNNGTLEPRIYQGYDRATNVKDQAELFGVHNLFLFDPNGFAPANVSPCFFYFSRLIKGLLNFTPSWEFM